MANLSQYNQEPMISEDKPKNKRWFWWVGGCLTLMCFVICGGIGFFWFTPPPEDLLDAGYTLPNTVQQGDKFDLFITMTNPTSEPIFVRHIVLDETVGPSILDGSSVIGSEPEMTIDDLYLPDKIAYSYFQPILPKETQTVVFHLQAEAIGTFGGSISAYSSENPFVPFAFFFYEVTITITP